jgi:uncharacterized protein
MSVLAFTLLVWCGALAAGFVGALTGLGGGVIIVPLVTLAFGADIRYAVGASLVSVMATSSGSAAAYVKDGFTNLRVGMLLEIATTSGALLGAFIAALVSTKLIAVTFGLVLISSAAASLQRRHDGPYAGSPDRLARWLRLGGSYRSLRGPLEYTVTRVPAGGAIMFVAGALSGLLGIGSGALKVLALDQAMRLPFKVSTTTSNFMMGVTAAASAGVYLNYGYLDPGLVLPVMLGVLPGAMLGARTLARVRTPTLRLVFAVVIVGVGVEMVYKGLSGRL